MRPGQVPAFDLLNASALAQPHEMGQGPSWLQTQGPNILFGSSTPLLKLWLRLALLWLWWVLDASLTMAACSSVCQCSLQSASCVQEGLTSLPSGLPASLRTLDLRWNGIVDLRNLTDFQELQVLYLSNNSLTTLRAEDFDTVFNLRNLDLSYNSISTAEDKVFGNLSALEIVNLAFNQLTNVHQDMLFGLDNVRVLNLSGNLISELSNQTFLYLRRLRILDLNYNKLRCLPNDVFQGLESVLSIFLRHNYLTSVTGLFNNLQHLQTVDLSYNILHSLPSNTFKNVLRLNMLQLSFNKITVISPIFCGDLSYVRTLHLQGNSLERLDARVFQYFPALQVLDLSQMPYLRSVNFEAMDGAYSLTLLNLSFNPHLSFLHPQLLASLPELTVIDLRCNNISSLSPITFHSNLRLSRLFLSDNPLHCGCGNAWLADQTSYSGEHVVADLDSVKCELRSNGTTVPISRVPQELMRCNSIVTTANGTSTVYAKIGAQLVLKCSYEADENSVLTWMTPRGLVFHYHPFHPDATSQLVQNNVAENLTAGFHMKSRHWSHGYNSDLQYSVDHIVLQSDGSLSIDFILRSDAGSYQCIVHNSQHNATATITVLLDYRILFEVKIMGLIVGMGCAAAFFVLNTVYVIIMWAARKLINKRRRERIHKLLISLEDYRTTQIARIRTNYSFQLGRIREHYHSQSLRLRENYTVQMKKVRQGCSNQVERIRDNYHMRMNHLKDYSSHQIQQIREATNNQMIRIRDYGSLQMERLRENCKLQQRHVIKVIEAMNMENCRSVVETECMRTQSIIFDIDFPDLVDDICSEDNSSENSQSESIYTTAPNTENSSQDATLELDCQLTPENVTIEIIPCNSTDDENNFFLSLQPSSCSSDSTGSEIDDSNSDTSNTKETTL